MKLIESLRYKVGKAIIGGVWGANTAYTHEHFIDPTNRTSRINPRGIQVYNFSSLVAETGRDKEGRLVSAKTEQPLFYLTIEQRNEIFRLCSPVFGVVTSRMNRISSLPYHVVAVEEVEDRMYNDFKSMKEIYDEYLASSEFSHLTLKAKIFKELRDHLPELKMDLSNFNKSLVRWKRRIREQQRDKTEEIENWLSEPNAGVTWDEYVKKWVYDMHIHGCAATYKQYSNGMLTNFDTLIGGSVYKLKYPFFSGIEGYVQHIFGYETQIYFGDEISYTEYVPTSVRNYSMIPLEALINKITEVLLFDQAMAERADGTRPPEKAVVVTDSNPFGDFDKELGDQPIDTDEQQRIEEKLNEPIKHGIITFSGNQATVVDLSRADTLESQRQRQKDVREEVGLVFNMSNMEMNLTGSEQVSGRATSETQQEIDLSKGVAPIVQSLEIKITRDILNKKYGYGYMLELEKASNEKEEKDLDQVMLRTGELTQNELREKYNKPTFEGDQYDLPSDNPPQELGADAMNPMFSRMVE